MRRASLRTLALLLTLTLLAQLFPLSALADAPSFSNLYDACDYLRTCMDARETEIALFLDENACARWETDEVREALEDTMAMAGLIGVRVDRHEDRSADVRISIEYCDAVRMVDAYRSGDLSGLSAEEQQCLAMAVEAATQLRAMYGDALSLEKAIYDLICRNVTYRNYPDTTSVEFSRVVTVPSAMLEGVGNCQAYARMFYLLGTLCGLKVGFLSGWYADHDEGQHIWNTIELNGQLYMVDVTDGDFDNADESAPQVQYRSFNIGWDRVPADSWNWWPPACDDRIRNDTDPDLWYYNNQPGYGGCSTELGRRRRRLYCAGQGRIRSMAGHSPWPARRQRCLQHRPAKRRVAPGRLCQLGDVGLADGGGHDLLCGISERLEKMPYALIDASCPQAGGLRALTKPTNAKLSR